MNTEQINIALADYFATLPSYAKVGAAILGGLNVGDCFILNDGATEPPFGAAVHLIVSAEFASIHEYNEGNTKDVIWKYLSELLVYTDADIAVTVGGLSVGDIYVEGIFGIGDQSMPVKMITILA